MPKTQATSVSLAGTSAYKWTVSPADADEYYIELIGGGDPSLSEPTDLFAEGATLTAGTVGSLTVGTWDYGDNDTLGYSTIYVRLASDADPQDTLYGDISASTDVTLAHFSYTVGSVVTRPVVTTTKHTLVAATVTKVLDSNAAWKYLGAWDESGATLYYAVSASAPSDTDTMAPVPANGALLNDRLMIPEGNLYLYSTAGGVVKVEEGV